MDLRSRDGGSNLTITYLSGTEDTSGTLVGGSLEFSVTPHASTAVGDPIIVQIAAYTNAPPVGADTATAPRFAEVGRANELGLTGGGIRVYCIVLAKIAEASDLGASITVTLGPAFAAFGLSNRVKAHTIGGGLGFSGATVTATRPPGSSGGWTVTPAAPTRRAMGFIAHGSQASIGTLLSVPNGWVPRWLSAGNAAHLVTVGPQSPPLPSPTLAATPAGRAIVSFCITDVPERRRGGLSLQTLTIGGGMS